MRRHVVRYVAVLPLVLLATSGCFHSANTRPGRDPNVITQDEIDAAQATDALNLIARLRGDFLVNRGKVSLTDQNASSFPTVYVDGTRYGDAAILRTIPASQVQTVRLYRAWEAQTKFGAGNASGVIELTTRR